MQATMEFYFLAGTVRRTQARFPQYIRWHAPPPLPTPYITLNTDGSALSNPGIAGAGGILRDHLGHWIASFSLHLGIATNNTAELAAV